MQYAVTHVLSDDGGRPDKLVAVVDGRGADADSEHRPRYMRQAKYLASVLTQVNSSFTRHNSCCRLYPDRFSRNLLLACSVLQPLLSPVAPL